MIVTKHGLVTHTEDEHGPVGVVLLKCPAKCPACNRMVVFVKNRNGRSLCAGCDDLRCSSGPSDEGAKVV